MDGEEKSSIAGDRFAQHHVPLGNLKLGYLCFEVADVPRWQRLLQGVIGMVPADDDALVFTHDYYQHRVSLSHGASDDITAAGWEAGRRRDLDAIVERLEQGGVRLREGSGDQQRARRVERLVCFEDPDGNPLELFRRPAM